MVVPYFVTPSGPTNPSNVLAVSIVLPALCFVAIVLRFNARRVQKTGLKLDDWLTLPALVLVIGMDICAILGVHLRFFGYNTSTTLTISSAIEVIKLLIAFSYFQSVALVLIKFAALAFYGRIFSVKSTRTIFDMIRMATWVIVALWGTSSILMTSLQCGTHFAAQWGVAEEFIMYCTPYEASFQKASVIPDVILDVWILLLPLPKIFSLCTTKARKFAVSGVFLLAAIGLVGSIAWLVDDLEALSDIFDASADPQLEDTAAIYWSNLEAGMSLLAVNLPTLWFYVSHGSAAGIFASIRGLLSLQSFRSKDSQGSRRLNSKDGPLSQSTEAVFPPGDRTEAWAMHDVEAQRGMTSRLSKDVIVVNSTYATEN